MKTIGSYAIGSASPVGGYSPWIWLMALLLVAFTAGCSGTVTVEGPAVSAVLPVNAATGVARNTNIVATFSRQMDAATITDTTFTLKRGTTPVAGVVTYTGNTATFNPTGDLLASTVYTATITTGVKDLEGIALSVAETWEFTTGTTSDTAAPTVISTIPANSSTGVTISGNVAVTFSEAMNPTTVTATTFTLKQGTTPVAGVVTSVGSTATFNPTSTLAASTVYTATLTTGVKDLAGNALATAKTWSFTTGTTADTIAPTVKSTVPLNAATGVALNANITATFSEPMDPGTITASTVTVKQGTTPVAGVVTYVGTTATFNPIGALTASTVYTATIATGVKDLAGNALVTAKTWSFTTGATAALGPDPVVLGTAGDYAILAETAISTTATAGTVITGDMGISPAAATYITGFGALPLDATGCFSTSTLVVGKIYAADYNAPASCPTPANLTTAVGDMMIAYTDAAGRSLPDFTELYAGDISGKTLVPGLYKWSTGVLITSDVTLNGGPNDVWIFQIAGDITQANGTSMLLTGGALPKNIFWQVGGGTGVSIGTTAHFEGVILAAKAITLNTGSTGNGRLLAQTAVTLDATTVTEP